VRKWRNHESSPEISGWKHVASFLDALTATAPSVTDASTLTPPFFAVIAGARMK